MLPRAYDPAVRLVIVALALVLPPSAQAVLVQFRTPSANIGCVYTSEGGSYLRCDILSGLKPKPPRPKGCELDWTFGFQMKATGRARTVCAGDTTVDKRARVLTYGRTWSRGGFKCTSRRSGLRCSNRHGHGFVLSRAHSFRF
jgi:uncharacterized protein DUF6636